MCTVAISIVTLDPPVAVILIVIAIIRNGILISLGVPTVSEEHRQTVKVGSVAATTSHSAALTRY